MNKHLNINTSIIPWAIKRAGYDIEDFSAKHPNIQAWIEKKKTPTLKQLQDFSHKVYLPFGYLFLPEPPREKLPIALFRTGKQQTSSVSLNLSDTIRLIERRQQWLVDYLRDLNRDRLEFAGKYNLSNSKETIVKDIRETLSLSADWAGACRDWEQALNFLTQKIEEAGIIIVFNSIVENNTRRPIVVNECRGFVLVDPMAPFMFINAADARAAQMFTIAHELAHIWLGKSAGFDYKGLQPADTKIEQLCDAVAAELLVPDKLFTASWKNTPDIKKLARYFKVSPIVVARRALDLGKLNKGQFFKFYSAYIGSLQVKRESKQTGGDFYVTQKKRIGIPFAMHVNQAISENKLLFRDAYKLTGLKGDTYQKFTDKAL